MATAAGSIALDPASDELLRDTRARVSSARSEMRARWLLSLTALAVAAGIVACAALIHAGPVFSWWRTLAFVVLYAVASRVEFEVGLGAAIPTQVVLVPMLFALPLGLVPAVVAAGLLLRTAPDRPWPLREPAHLFAQFSSTAHAIGPVLVLGLAGGLPLRWSAWPIYVAALAAQFAFDCTNAVANTVSHRVSLRTLPRILSIPYLVDCALSPVGLAIAFASVRHAMLASLGLPLVGLLAVFARERRGRIDSALELSHAYRGTTYLLGDVIDADDAYTGSHSRHVVDLVLGVCDTLGLSPADRRDAEFAALLHDVGKIRIPDAILNKPGPLTPDERAIVEMHCEEGERMLTQVGGLLGQVGRIVRSCHEHWDGAGYPDRLAGDAIPLVARIVGACDAYSAMTTDRPYRAALSEGDALAELARCAGTQFDPQVVGALIRVVTAGG